MQSGLKNLQFASETSQTCVRNVRKGGQEFFSRAKTFFFKGKNFFFQGQKLFFSGASKTSTKRTHPRGPKPEKRSGHARKSPKVFFLLDQTFFLRGPKSFSLGCFFRVWGGFFRFFSEVPHPNPKSNKRNCTRTAPPCRRAQPRKKMAPKGPAPIRLYEIALHARPPSPAAKSKKFEKFEFGASNGLVWGQTIRQSTQLDELRRSRKVSASEDTILKSYGHLKLVPIFSWFSLFAKNVRFWPGHWRPTFFP